MKIFRNGEGVVVNGLDDNCHKCKVGITFVRYLTEEDKDSPDYADCIIQEDDLLIYANSANL